MSSLSAPLPSHFPPCRPIATPQCSRLPCLPHPRMQCTFRLFCSLLPPLLATLRTLLLASLDWTAPLELPPKPGHPDILHLFSPTGCNFGHTLGGVTDFVLPPAGGLPIAPTPCLTPHCPNCSLLGKIMIHSLWHFSSHKLFMHGNPLIAAYK